MRLIDADALAKRVKEFRDDAPQSSIRRYVCNVILSMLGDENQTPTIKAEPVRHGRWKTLKHKKGYWGFDSDGDFGCYSDYPVICTACSYDLTENGTPKTNYCPNCGAKMDGDEK